MLCKNRSWLFAYPEVELSAELLSEFQQYFARREQGEPIAHILGRREFWGLDLAVNASTLIPRPDTETLVEVALELPLPADATVVDLGVGTGAIALALASERPRWQVSGVDASEAAVALAQQNAVQTALPTVRFIQSDWFAALTERRFDLIVSNPPYIDKNDHHLGEGDVRFEPASALVAERNGLADIEHIVAQAPQFLNGGGYLMLEHGFEQGEAVVALLAQTGFSRCTTVKDLGGQDRVSYGQWPRSEQRNG